MLYKHLLILFICNWIRAYDHPLNRRNKETAKQLGDKIGEFLELDESNRLGWGEYLRFRVRLDVRDPLMRGTMIRNKQGKSQWVYFKYERLSNFCYYCGCPDHMIRDCDTKENGDDDKLDDNMQYGQWLRASLIKKPDQEHRTGRLESLVRRKKSVLPIKRRLGTE